LPGRALRDRGRSPALAPLLPTAMPPKKQPEEPEEPRTPEEDDPEIRPLVWVYGVNDHMDCPSELPAKFEPTGKLCTDFRSLCRLVGVAPHPAFKQRKSVEKSSRSRRPSVISLSASNPMVDSQPAKEGPMLSIRSILLDRMAMQLMSLLLPTACHVKVLCLSDCRLDGEMLKLLRAGLREESSVESLQIEWNPLELPLPSAEELEAQAAEGEAAQANADTGSVASSEAAGGGGAKPTGDGGGSELEARERSRYRSQSQRHLRCFREWLQNRFGGSMEGAWQLLAQGGADPDALLAQGEFHDVLEARLGMTGPQVTEVFEVLDGPDYAAGQARVSLTALRETLEGLPEEPASDDPNDPIGLMFTPFVDGECVLESVSLRACALGRMELKPLSDAIARCPWQLRCLNLWDNRVCDRGAGLLAAALESYRGLEYLGLGKNRVTETGLASLCKPFNTEVLDEARLKAAQDRIKLQVTEKEAAAKAKAKAQPKAKPAGSRYMREALTLVDEVEEGGETVWTLRRPCELRALVFTDNPIGRPEIIEALQPLGPRGAELVLRGTPAGAALAARRPDLVSRPTRPGGHHAGQAAGATTGDGWVLRVA